MTRVAMLSVCLICGLVTGASPASAQSPGTFEIHASPDKVPPGVPVRLTGSLPDDGRGGPPAYVSITVTPPKDGPPTMPPTFELQAPVGKDGAFDVELTRTGRLGRYRLEARSPGGHFTADGTFDTVPVKQLAEDTAREHDALVRDTERLLVTLEQVARNLPPTPDRQKVLKYFVDIGYPTLVGDDVLLVIGEITVSPVYHRAMQEWRTKSKATRALVDRRDLASADRCEAIEQLIEGLNLASALFNLIGTPLEIAVNFAKDAIASQSEHFLTQQGVKQVPNLIAVKQAKTVGERVWNRARAVPGLLFDLGALIAGGIFDLYCTSLSGTMAGEHRAKFSKGGKTWWTYRELLGGRLFLRYPKDVPTGSPVPVRGEFIGTGFGFEADWNRIAALAPNLLATTGMLYLHGTFPPIGVPPELQPTQEGKAVAGLGPRAFFVVVEGEMVGRDITLRLGPARTDFTAMAKAFYLMMSPLTMSIDMDILDLPYKDARTVLSRAASDGPMRFRLAREEDGDVAATTFRAKKEGTVDGDLAEGWYEVSFKVCAGGCKP